MNIPYAMFSFTHDDGKSEWITMEKTQFSQAIRDGRICKCGSCLACRALEYLNDARLLNKNSAKDLG